MDIEPLINWDDHKRSCRTCRYGKTVAPYQEPCVDCLKADWEKDFLPKWEAYPDKA